MRILFNGASRLSSGREFLLPFFNIGEMFVKIDVNHVAFSSISKFDGRSMRFLAPNELAQIAGRAGRGMRDGSFGETGEVSSLTEDVVTSTIL